MRGSLYVVRNESKPCPVQAEERHEKEVADEIIRIADSIDQERKNRLDGNSSTLHGTGSAAVTYRVMVQARRRSSESSTTT